MEPDRTLTYLDDCRHRLEVAQVGHYQASSGFRTLHYVIGIPLVIATTVVSASLISDGGSDFYVWMSVVAAALAALQTFLRPNERAERHRTAATAYGALKRTAEVALVGDRADLQAVADRLVERWGAVAEVAPVTPRWARRQVADVLADDAAHAVPRPSPA